MKNTAIWKTNVPEATKYQGLETDITTQVAIIGGGITGLSAGYFLAKSGVEVVVLESEHVGAGTTGSSTGNIYVTIDEMYHQVADKFDRETMVLLAESRQAGLDMIEEIIEKYSIDCDFKKTSWNLIAESKKSVETLQKEYDAFVEAGISAIFHKESEILPNAEASLEVPEQAQLDPQKYIRGLAQAAAAVGCVIHENSRVMEIEETESGAVVLHTPRGKVHASHLIKATHSPKGEKIITALMGPYREYVVAAKLEGSFPKGIYWSQQGSHHYSMRTSTDGEGQEYLMCLGEPHKVGQDTDNHERLQRIERYMRERFQVGDVKYFWGAQHYKSADKIPYIGTFGDDQIYIATGYSTDGLVFGTVAGILLCDLIRGKENPWSKMYDPGRVNPMKSAGRVLKENVNVMGQLVKDWVFNADIEKAADVEKNEGKLVVVDGKKYGAYRDQSGKVHMVSAVCPHMGCIVHWNKSESTWDCPCHGSRFTTTGKCIEGPSLHDLGKMQNKDAS